MLTLSGNARIFLHQNPIDMRKSFEGLSVAVQESFPDLLMSGSYFVFLNKRRDFIGMLMALLFGANGSKKGAFRERIHRFWIENSF